MWKWFTGAIELWKILLQICDDADVSLITAGLNHNLCLISREKCFLGVMAARCLEKHTIPGPKSRGKIWHWSLNFLWKASILNINWKMEQKAWRIIFQLFFSPTNVILLSQMDGTCWNCSYSLDRQQSESGVMIWGGVISGKGVAHLSFIWCYAEITSQSYIVCFFWGGGFEGKAHVDLRFKKNLSERWFLFMITFHHIQ